MTKPDAKRDLSAVDRRSWTSDDLKLGSAHDLTIVAVRDDGALLVDDGKNTAAIVSDDGVWITTRGAALARGSWDEPHGETVPAELSVKLQDRLNEFDTEEAKVLDLVAAAEVQTGAMIALVPSDAAVEQLATEDGEAADQLHTTLVYLGEAAAFTPVMQDAIIDAIAQIASGIAPFDADGFGVAFFNPPGHASADDGKDRDSCVVLLVSCDELEPIKHVVCGIVEEIYAPFKLPEQHSPYVPHITLAYTETGDLSKFADKTSMVRFDTIRVAFAGETYDFPLGESRGDEEPEAVEYDEEYEQTQGAYATSLAFARKDINLPGSPGHQLHEYWTRTKKGLAKWAEKPHPWTSLYHHLRKYIHNDNEAKATAAKWFHDVKGYWPGDQKGQNPVGPG